MKQRTLMFEILVLAVAALYVPNAWAENEPNCANENSNTIAMNAKIKDGVIIPCDSGILIGDNSEFGVYKPEAIADAARETFVKPGCHIGANVRVGAGTQFGANCWVGDGVKIGKDATISHDAHVDTNAEIGNGASVGPHVHMMSDRVGGDILIPAWTCMTEACLGTTNINDHVFIDEKSAYMLVGFVMNIESRAPITPSTSHRPTGTSIGHGDASEINPNEWFVSVIPPEVCGTDMAVGDCTDNDRARVEYQTGKSPDSSTTYTFDVIEVNGVANGASASCKIFATAAGLSTARTTTGNLLTDGRGEHTYTFSSDDNLGDGVTMQCHVKAGTSAGSEVPF